MALCVRQAEQGIHMAWSSKPAPAGEILSAQLVDWQVRHTQHLEGLHRVLGIHRRALQARHVIADAEGIPPPARP